MEKKFIRVCSVKDIVIFTSLIIIGGVLIALPTSTAVNITGFFLIFTGLILAFILRTAFKDEETGEKYQKKEHYFPQAMNAAISSALASKPGTIDMSQEDKGNALRLDVYYNTRGKAYVQLFEYIPYKYEPFSKVFEYGTAEIENLIK